MKTYKNETGNTILINGNTVADDENFQSNVYLHRTGITLVEDVLEELIIISETDTLTALDEVEHTPDFIGVSEVEIQVLSKEGNLKVYLNSKDTQEAVVMADSAFNVVMPTEQLYKIFLVAAQDCEYVLNVIKRK
jgi:hypothetical protein